ncbi:MAG: hypothetical protein ACOX2F_03175 [bacterium]
MRILHFIIVFALLFFFFSCENKKNIPQKNNAGDNEAAVDNDNFDGLRDDFDETVDFFESGDAAFDDFQEISDFDEIESFDFEEIDDTVEIPDIDEFVPVDRCTDNADCSWNYICDYFQDPRDCIKIGVCENDYDCPGMQKCTRKEHWNECVPGGIPKTCSKDEDCEEGEFCEKINLVSSCRSKNKCLSDEECDKKEECILEDGYFQCINTAPCEIDTDCKFGYRCEIKEPENECVYANECVKDEDCNALSACVVDGNRTKCKLLGGGFCTNDSGCKIDEYCDVQLGLAGVCKSKNKCYKDADCEDERLICEYNGVYNDCVPKSPNWCLLDAMCDDGWQCVDNECRPPNYDQCKEISGKWTVRFSGLSLVTFNQGEVYEFLPKSGCNGDVRKEGATLFLGSFAETSQSNYEIDFFLIYKCSAAIYLGNLMNISCPDGSAQLARF